MKVVIGDFNAQVGRDNEGWKEVMQQQGLGEINDTDERLLSYCSANKLKVGGSQFTHKDIHKGTWRPPNELKVNQIDHMSLKKIDLIITRRTSQQRSRCWLGALLSHCKNPDKVK